MDIILMPIIEWQLCSSYTMLLRNWVGCTSPTFHNYIGWICLLDALANEENS